MTKIERVLRDLSDLYNFNRKIEEIKKANAQRLGLEQNGNAELKPGQAPECVTPPLLQTPPQKKAK